MSQTTMIAMLEEAEAVLRGAGCDVTADKVRGVLQAQQAEPVAMSLPFFAYDSETGFERFATEAEAKAAAQESIDAYREEAGEGWAEAVENICWGVVLGTTREVALPDEYSGGNGLADDMKPVDYVLTDAAQPPAVAEGCACKECGSTNLTWHTSNVIRSNVQQGRLSTNDVECLFYLGCDDCSETLMTMRADKVAGMLGKIAAAQKGGA